MTVTLTTFDKALKEFYLPPIVEQLDTSTIALNLFDKNTEDVEGRRAILSLHVSRNSGVGARAELGTLPSAGRQGYIEERVGMKYNYGTIRITRQTIEAAKSERGSFTRPLTAEMDGVMTDLKREVNRQVFNNSVQAIATCGTTSSSTTVTLLAAGAPESAMRFFEVGMVIDIGTSADADSVASAREITAVNVASKTITISGAAVSTTSGTHYVYRSGGGEGKELIGLREIVNSSGTLYNVDPSSYPIWKSEVYANGGTARTFTDTLIEQAIDNSDTICGSWADVILTSKGCRRNFVNQQKSNKRYDGEKNTVRAGYKGVPIDVGDNGEVTMITDRDCPNATAFGLATSRIKQHQMCDWMWEDTDGAVLSRASNGAHAFEAILFKFHELTTDKRAAHFRIDDLTES